MGSAVWVLLALLAPGPLRGSPPQLEVRGAGGQILLPCGASGSRLRWVWSPRYPKCAGVPGDLLEIARLPPGPEPPLAQFRGRLDPHPSALGSLLLRDLGMSDSGTFLCLGESGAQPPIRLEVTGGCRNNLTVSSNQTSPSALTLRCQRCPPLAAPASFRWFLNSRPLGNRRWATKREQGATVQLDPSRRAAVGRWECRLLHASSGGFEFCVAPPLGAAGSPHPTHTPPPAPRRRLPALTLPLLQAPALSGGSGSRCRRRFWFSSGQGWALGVCGDGGGAGTDGIETNERTKQEPPGPVYPPWKSPGSEPNRPKDASCRREGKAKSQAPCFTLKSSTPWWLVPHPLPLPPTVPLFMPLFS
ncbi:unnamed protein product, partial [Eretmochelys imbricata]